MPRKSRQTSEAAREASRLNGAKGRGPISAAGKALSARNAVKHGLRSAPLLKARPIPSWALAWEQELSLLAAPLDGTRRELIDIIVESGLLLDQAEIMIHEHLAEQLGPFAIVRGQNLAALEATTIARLHVSQGASRDQSYQLRRLDLLVRYERRFRRRRDRAARSLLDLIYVRPRSASRAHTSPS